MPIMTTRDRLIESTRQLLWERGYLGTSPRAILDRSGVGQGSMYYHFAGKSDLAQAAILRSAEELQAAAEMCLSTPGTAIERVGHWLTREREVLRGCPIGGLAQDADIVADPALRVLVEQTMDWLHRRLTAVFVEGRGKGDFATTLEPTDVAASVIAVLQGGYVLARSADSVEPFDQAVRGFMVMLEVTGTPGRECNAG